MIEVPADQAFQAFSDRTRLRILNFLAGGETCVGDLVNLLGVPQPTASRHLAILREAGLVATRKLGHWHFYSLAPARDELHERLLACLCACTEKLHELAEDNVRAARLRRDGGCCPLHGPGGQRPGKAGRSNRC